MSFSETSKTRLADTFSAGGTCPFCQNTVVVEEPIISCPRCAAVHHEQCWRDNGGCASYACDTAAHRNPDTLTPDLVITAAEAAATPPPPPASRAWQPQPVDTFLPAKPTRRSVLAVISLIFFALSLATFLTGVLARNNASLIASIMASMGALTTGVIALVMIHSEKKVYGTGPALAGLLGAAVVIFLSFLTLSWQNRHTQSKTRIQIQASESMPSSDDLLRMPEHKARAMRANVVVTGSSGFFSALSVGSGIILRVADKTAYILTNKHVLGDDQDLKIRILFHNGEESEAQIEWQAPTGIDIAVIRCQALSLAKGMGIFFAAQPTPQGETVFAVGNPMALYWSYTEGVISARRRQTMDGHEMSVYQTQTPINQGNSGGGLYNMRGELIGVNTWTQDKAHAEGLSFAIATKTIAECMHADKRGDLLPTQPSPQANEDQPE